MKTAGIVCALAAENFLIRKYYSEMLDYFGWTSVLLPVGYRVDLAKINLLVLAGGGDIHSSFFGAEPIAELRTVDFARDAFEIGLCQKAVKNNVPILGICRGMQVINVSLGGTIIQHLTGKQLARHDVNHHLVWTADDDFAQIAGSSSFAVNSFHHQALANIPKELKTVLYAEDGIAEGITGTENCPILGLQFHPERIYLKSTPTQNILKAFLGKL